MSARAKIVIAMNSASPASIWRWPDSATASLRAQFPEVEFLPYPRPTDQPASAAELESDARLFADADAAIAWRLNPRLWRDSARMRWIHCPAAAVTQLLSPELIASDIAITNGASVHSGVVAEHALALMLALGRGLGQSFRDQHEARWAPQPWLDQLAALDGAAVLLLGAGHIGRALAPRLAALGAHVTGVRRHPERGAPGFAEMHAPEELDDLLPRADFLVLALPDLASTRRAIGVPQLARMRPGAMLVNIGRGAALDEAALAAALESGRLAGAALDVFAQEPLPQASPLWRAPRCIITPHTAAFTPDTWVRQTRLIASHLKNFLSGARLSPLVDKSSGY